MLNNKKARANPETAKSVVILKSPLILRCNMEGSKPINLSFSSSLFFLSFLSSFLHLLIFPSSYPFINSSFHSLMSPCPHVPIFLSFHVLILSSSHPPTPTVLRSLCSQQPTAPPAGTHGGGGEGGGGRRGRRERGRGKRRRRRGKRKRLIGKTVKNINKK